MEGDTSTMINDTIIMKETKPNWANMMDDDDKCILAITLILMGTISAIFLTLLMSQRQNLILGKLKNMRSYDTLYIFITVMYIRTLIGLFSRFDSLRRIAIIWFQRCDMLPFLETFFAVFEVEALTHMCIERYVVTKYITKGWKIVVGHYHTFSCLCLLFAVLYSAPPLFGLGRYGCDFGCVSCTYSMMLPDTWQRYLISTVFFLRSFKPAAFMLIMLFWAMKLENDFDTVMAKKADLHFTECVKIVTIMTLACWSPIALTRAYVVLSQLLFDEIYIPSTIIICCAMIVHEATPIFTTTSIFLFGRLHPCKYCQTDKIANVADDNEPTPKKD